MIEGVGEAVVRRPPEAIIAFVTDLERYKKADWKIGRVIECRRDGDRIFMRHGGTMRGIPGPPVALEMVVAETSVRYRSLRSFASRFVLTFDGGFEMEVTPEGTHVVHTERFHFFTPWRWLAEPYLRAWIAADVQEIRGRDASLTVDSFPRGGRPPAGTPRRSRGLPTGFKVQGLAVDDTHVYWTGEPSHQGQPGAHPRLDRPAPWATSQNEN